MVANEEENELQLIQREYRMKLSNYILTITETSK